MKKLIGMVLATATYIGCANVANAGLIELAVNGGFETGDFTGWTQFPNSGTQAISNVNPASGTFAANLTMNNTADGNVIKNANIGIGQVVSGQTVNISFAARGATQAGGVAFAEFFSELSGGGTSSSEILGGAQLALNADSNVWTTFSFSTFAGPDVSGGVTLQFVAVCGAAPGCVSDIFFDDASVTIEGAVPSPATLTLLGLGLAGLGFSRRGRA